MTLIIGYGCKKKRIRDGLVQDDFNSIDHDEQEDVDQAENSFDKDADE